MRIFLAFLTLLLVSCSHSHLKKHKGIPGEVVSYERTRSELELVFYPKPHEKLEIYFKNSVDSLGVEFALCLYGHVQDSSLVIKGVEFPPQYQKHREVNVRYDMCDDDFIAIGHAHPNAMYNAGFSKQDVSVSLALHDSKSIDGSVLFYRLFGIGPIRIKVLDPEKVRGQQEWAKATNTTPSSKLVMLNGGFIMFQLGWHRQFGWRRYYLYFGGNRSC